MAGPLRVRWDRRDRDGAGIDKSHHLPGGAGFANPWPSWAKPSLLEFWSGLSWYTQEDGEDNEVPTSMPSRSRTDTWSNHLTVEKPDFETSSSDHNRHVRTYWLGHAGVLVELPMQGGGMLRVLFDPIFSQRCSPSQYAGPVRFTPSPVSVSDLPRIDLVIISHDHYDHLDADTVSSLWQANRQHIRFVLPLGNASWMESLLGPECIDRVTEMDWWDEATFWGPGSSARPAAGTDQVDTLLPSFEHQAQIDEGEDEAGNKSRQAPAHTFDIPDSDHLRVICTPAQHGSGRFGFDGGRSLWASYTLLYQQGSSESPAQPFHLYFAGDTGYRLRPPNADVSQLMQQPACPAFQQIHDKFGSPDLLLLPVSVGSTYSYLKSWDYVGLLPDVDGGLTAQNHLDEWEAVEVARILTGQSPTTLKSAQEEIEHAERNGVEDTRTSKAHRRRRPLALAIHFGTFSPSQETRATLRRLKRACKQQSWRAIRHLDDKAAREEGLSHDDDDDDDDDDTQGDFLVLNPGQFVQLPL
ncbi:unnamed protein product [Parajaminaea phylloscopi]